MNFPLNTPSMEQNNVASTLLVSRDALHLWKLSVPVKRCLCLTYSHQPQHDTYVRVSTSATHGSSQ